MDADANAGANAYWTYVQSTGLKNGRFERDMRQTPETCVRKRTGNAIHLVRVAPQTNMYNISVYV
eukprot:11184782-Lingulodinium_polyedra.AAC.1